MQSLHGQVAMVTGGATGIGAAIVKRLAELGARVGCCYRTSQVAAECLAENLNRNGMHVFPVQVDVTESQQVKAAVDSITRHLDGPISILVNNAGEMFQTVTIDEMSEEIWDKIIAVNLKGVFLCAKYCIPVMKAQKRGWIVNISSLAARAGGGPGSVHYAATKGGVESFTRGLAKELGPFNIFVNAVAPGVIGTTWHQRYKVAPAFQDLKQSIPLRRIGVPEDVVGAVVFLVSQDSSYITGEVINANGGLRMD